MILSLLLACTSTAPPSAPPAAQTPATDSRRAEPAPEPGWGALLFRDEVWMRTGGGEVAVGPKGAQTLQPTGSVGGCGPIVQEAEGAMFALPEGKPAPEITPAPPIQAATVERAAWRLDELLPPLDRFAPLPSSPDPSRSRGVNVGSVVKVRRPSAPPVLVATGYRECTGVLAVLSADAGQTLAYDLLDGACEPLRALAPSDLDGDGQRELGAWSRSRAALYRLADENRQPRLLRLGDWSCR